MIKIEGLDKLQDLVRKFQTRKSTLQAMDGEVVDERNTFTPGPYLHQDVKDEDGNIILTEEESSRFERDNPELFRILRDLKVRIDRSMLG